MKKILSISVLTIFFVVSSCDSNFDAINTDPNRISADVLNPNLLLPTIEFSYANMTLGYGAAVLFQSMWIQALASTSTGGAVYYANGDKYVETGSTNSYIASAWNNGYSNASRINQMRKIATERNLTNLNAVGGIMKVLTLSYVSDVYGDIPLSEATRAEEGIFQPKYDAQSEVYKSLLAELDASLTALGTGTDLITNDVLYRGDIPKWKKLGYSIMLRMALRLIVVDRATATTYVTKAVAGGVFASAADEAVLVSDEANGYSNAMANAMNVPDDTYEVRWSKRMIDFLISKNDPRMPVVAEVPPPGLIANRNGALVGDNNPAIQIGLPNGFDLTGTATDISRHPNFPGGTGSGGDVAVIGAYSRPTGIYRRRNAPTFILTNAEVQFMLAEAAARGLISGSAASFYRAGLIDAQTSLSKFGGGAVSASAAVAFADANPLSTGSVDAQLKDINEQYWVATSLFSNFVEAWNNWRRSGYPVLTPVNFAGNFSNGQIPRRQLFPLDESTLNTQSRNDAVARMGGDTWITKMWWDGGR